VPAWAVVAAKKLWQCRISRRKLKPQPDADMLRRCHVARFHARFVI